jgi:hypothetical protein
VFQQMMGAVFDPCLTEVFKNSLASKFEGESQEHLQKGRGFLVLNS